MYEFQFDDSTVNPSMPRRVRVVVPPDQVLNIDFLPALPTPGTTEMEWNGMRFEFEWN